MKCTRASKVNNKSEWADEAIERINSLSSDEFWELIWSCMPIDEAKKLQHDLNYRKVAINRYK